MEVIHDPFCRGAIRHDFDLSDRDYRLSYALSLVCAKDRTALCSSVDSANVLKCMIEKVEEIKDPECEQDVSRLAFVALSEEEDVIEKSVCAADVEKFCATDVHNSVHSCLLNRLSELSIKCAENVLNLHSSVPALKSMEKVLNNLCSSVLVSEDCRHQTSSLNDKVDCIRGIERSDISRVSRPCLDQLIAIESLLSADYRTNKEIQSDCKTDLESLCGELPRESATFFDNPRLMCLVSNRLRIRNSRCKHHIVSTIYRMSDNLQYVPNMRSVCGDDITKFCKDVIPENGQLHECLRENFASISHDCQSQEFVIEQAEAIAGTTRNACELELSSICSSSPDLHCLWRNVDEVSGPCRDQVRNEMKGKIGNIWLDPMLYTRCRSTVNEFIRNEDMSEKCPFYLQELPIPLNGLIPLPSNYTQAIGGEHVYCLGSYRSKIADRACLKSVEKIIREEMKDPVLLQHGLRNACKRDLALKGVCGHTDPFDTAEQWRCLQGKFKSSAGLTYSCLESVKKALKTSVSDVQFNPEIDSKCKSEIEEFHCKNAFSGVIPCLIRKFKLSTDYYGMDSAIVFSEDCAEAVKRLPELSDLGLNKVLLKLDENTDASSEPDTGRLLGQEQETVIGSTSIELSGSLAFVSLGSLFVVIAAALYKMYRWRMNKGYMVIVDKA